MSDNHSFDKEFYDMLQFISSIVFFVFSLPFLNILFAHYIPYLVKGTGELTIIGLIVKSLLAGLVFWIFHRIVAPLLTSS